jgi:riboflavin biosynthesis pyrimidine reductase
MSFTITNVMAVSLDGNIGKKTIESDEERHSYNFSNQDDKEWVRDQLSRADAVITGANSLRAAGQSWTVKNDVGCYPLWMVLSTRGLAPELPFWNQSEIRRVLVSPSPLQADLCAAKGVENLVGESTQIAQIAVQYLKSHNLNRVLLFGGGEINRMFYSRGLVDFAKITLCPLIIGAVSSPKFVNAPLEREVNLELISSVIKGNLIFLTYKIQK